MIDSTSNLTERLVDDARRAARIMEDLRTFETGQGILIECANTIKNLTAENDRLKARVVELESALEAASVLAARAEAVFSSEYINTRHLEGSRHYFDRNCEVLRAFRTALKNKDASDD